MCCVAQVQLALCQLMTGDDKDANIGTAKAAIKAS